MSEVPKKARSRRRARVIAVTVLAVLVAVVGCVLSLPWLDRQGMESVRCTVLSAEAGSTSGAGKGGTGSAVVWIETSDCGKLIYSDGVTPQNREHLAAELNRGGTFDFDMGMVSRWLKSAGSPLGRALEVRSFAPHG